MPILVRVLLLALATFVLSAPTFGGTPKAQKNMVIAWSGAVLLTAYFLAMMQAETGLEGLQGEFIGGLNMTFLAAQHRVHRDHSRRSPDHRVVLWKPRNQPVPPP
jgi:hypothetical protein